MYLLMPISPYLGSFGATRINQGDSTIAGRIIILVASENNLINLHKREKL